MRKLLPAHLALFTVNLIYGANYTIAKIAMPEYIQPFAFILVRVVSGALFFLLVHRLFIRERIERQDMIRLALCGLFGVAINQLLFFRGLDWTTPINASLIMITAPIMVLVFSALLLKERIPWVRTLGILFGAAGAATIIAFGHQIEVASNSAMGDILVFINASSYALYLVLVKPLMTKYHPLTVIKWVFLFGSLVVIPAGAQQLSVVEWHSYTNEIWASIAFVVICTTIMAYGLNIYALRAVPPAVVGGYIYLQPVLATMIAVAWGKDHVDLVKVLAALLIFTGVWLVSKPIRKVPDKQVTA